ncbi:NAD(P)-dependent dehydrogenase, short-chain alcohol dehydrogenase family [Haloechinothrix alba]|uniref:NAD(P)-dependent dehydrogenase, short-chain alcohol dehydrogenase family n=1 Tax=Haloechinothrix alba TaxID=664784 RepID=A0A238ZH31_9PSEU|nr:NAD(P)-dependent dehydrogenase, short-chain alcohol dehydrogenase family [Haloechinothrix alba]
MVGVKDRVVVVTGAGGGLGREYAMLLAREGARVVVNDLGGARDGSGESTAMADQVVREIREAGGDAVASYDSVDTEEGARAIIGTAVAEYGGVHGIVNNAGILRDRAFHKMTAEDWEAVLRVHLFGSYHVTSAAWPYFREQRYGRVVMAASTSGLFGNFGQANYGSAKAGLVGLVNTLAIEGSKHNITANAVAPMAATRMTEDVAPPEMLAKLPPEQVAPLVGYLLTEECTDTGMTLVAGGGTYYRVQPFQSAGLRFEQTPSMDDVAAQWHTITDMTDATPGVNPVG